MPNILPFTPFLLAGSFEASLTFALWSVEVKKQPRLTGTELTDTFVGTVPSFLSRCIRLSSLAFTRRQYLLDTNLIRIIAIARKDVSLVLEIADRDNSDLRRGLVRR